MGPFYGHLFRDAVPERLLRQTAFRVCCWIERMNRSPLDQRGWLADDAMAETLHPVLRVMADGVPMLLDAVSTIDDWADANPNAAPPRAIGLCQSPYRDTERASRRRARGHRLGGAARVQAPASHGETKQRARAGELSDIASCTGLVIGEDCIDHAARPVHDDGVGVQVVGESHQRDGQRRAAPSRPGRVIDR